MYKSLATLAATVALSGCALLNTLSNEVSTYSQWPAERKPGSFVFERLPSQQSQPERQAVLEGAAQRAIEAAGFTPAGAGKPADYVIQLGARVSPNERSIYDDPFWWHGGLMLGRGHRGSFWGTGLGFTYSPPTYAREVAVLIRDRASSTPLYEARATNDGGSPNIDSLLPAMFDAALMDFPYGGPNPRTVRIDLSK